MQYIMPRVDHEHWWSSEERVRNNGEAIPHQSTEQPAEETGAAARKRRPGDREAFESQIISSPRPKRQRITYVDEPEPRQGGPGSQVCLQKSSAIHKNMFVGIESELIGNSQVAIPATPNGQWYQNTWQQAPVEAGRSHVPSTSKSRKGPKSLPDWIRSKWAKVFLPTLTHALYISKDPFEEFKPTSPTFIATVQKIFSLVYSDTICDTTEDDAVVEEAAQRLCSKKSRIVIAVMQEVKHFFEQPQYAGCPDKIKAYARWALQPDGPAFHETPTPVDCKVERSDKNYIQPKGTFQSLFLSRVAKQFLVQTNGSVLEPSISASNPPKGLYGLLLVSVERAFLAFRSGSYIKPKTKFSHENYWTELETYISHLDTVSQQHWETILCHAKASDVNTVAIDEHADASLMSINRRNLYIPESMTEP